MHSDLGHVAMGQTMAMLGTSGVAASAGKGRPMTVITALQQNLDKVEAAHRDLDRLEERAAQLRATLLALLAQDGSLAGGDNDAVVSLTR